MIGTQPMLRPPESEMTQLDRVVYDPRFLPYYGWHDDHRQVHNARMGHLYFAAMWQVRSEFHAFAALLAERDINGRCLQLGLGFCASHVVFQQLFDDVWTIELDQGNVDNLTRAVGPVETVIVGSTHDHHVQDKARESGNFDLLFIDADHRLDDVRADFNDYAPLVKRGGMIAFHDAYPENSDNGVWLFLNMMRAAGQKISVIGDEIGIVWIMW